ncbi:unnamed protein product [Hydatigera taeniaeformis]|uniref:Uncharacterized protein n=1 Tax=Hydatigena taeniaeformis TaxID=6205 RepID=A0A3P7FQG2_HYDTA|nr:unnamed protein product [Hydatigera taeniaeformis]
MVGRWRKITPFTGHGGWVCERGECMCLLVDRWKCASPKCIHFTSLPGCSSRRVANIPTVLDKLTLFQIVTPRLPHHSHPSVPHCGSLSLAPPLLPVLRFFLWTFSMPDSSDRNTEEEEEEEEDADVRTTAGEEGREQVAAFAWQCFNNPYKLQSSLDAKAGARLVGSHTTTHFTSGDIAAYVNGREVGAYKTWRCCI